MNIKAISAEKVERQDFETEQIAFIAVSHFIHDMFSGFTSPLLPLLMEKLSISLSLAGALAAFGQVPAVLNPIIGYFADRRNLKYLVIFAPAITATLTSCLGLAPNYLVVAVLLFISGVSSTLLHAPSPAILGRVAGRRLGRGMSWFMAGGELGRTIGPLLVVWAVSLWSLEGIYRLMVIGWATSILLLLRLRNVSTTQPGKLYNLKEMIPDLVRVFLPLGGVVICRNFLIMSFAVYLPTYMRESGSSLWMAGAALSIYEVAGVAGALTSGGISDRLGRKPVLAFSMLGSFLFLLVFLNVAGWLVAPALLGIGFLSLSSGPVLLAIVQENFPNHRAVANGIFMSFSFLMQSLVTLILGLAGDRWGLQATFLWSGFLALCAIAPIYWLPKKE